MVGLFTLLGAALRIQGLGHSLWLDELHTAWVAHGPLSEVASRAQIGNHSPLFFYAEWVLARMFGLREVSLRSLCVVAGTGMIVLSAWAMWRWTASSIATVTIAGLLAVDRLMIFYAQDARPYALLELVALFQLISLIEVLKDARCSWRIALVASSATMLYLHYTSVLLLVAEAIYVASRWCGPVARQQAAYRPLLGVVDAVGIVILALPLLPHTIEVASRRGNWAAFVPRPTAIDLFTMFPLDVWFLSPALAAGMVYCMTPKSKVEQSCGLRRHLPLLRFFLGIFFLLLVFAWIGTRFDIARVFLKRYLMIVAIAPLFATAIIGASFRQRSLRATYLVTLIVGLAISPFQPSTHSVVRSLFLNNSISGHAREDWRAAAEYVRTRKTKPAPIFVRSGFIECTEENLADPRWQAYGILPLSGIYDLSAGETQVFPLPSDRPWDLTRDATAELISAGEGWFVLRAGAELAKQTATRVQATLNPWGQWRVTERAMFEGRPSIAVFHIERSGLSRVDDTVIQP